MSQTHMSQTQSFTENRHQIDNLMMSLVVGTRIVVRELVRPLVTQGRFSMGDIPAESRGSLRTVSDIAETMDASALLAVLMQCLSDTGPGLEIEGVSFELVDKVRRIRNDHAHGRGDYNDPEYVSDSMLTIVRLAEGLLNAGEEMGIAGIESMDTRRREERTEKFFRAYSQGRLAAAAAVARQGLNQGARNESGISPMPLAIRDNCHQVVVSLVEGGADPNGVFPDGDTPLGLAVRCSHVEVVQALLAAGADPNGVFPDGDTPLGLAVRCNHVEVVQALLAVGADPQLEHLLRTRAGEMRAMNPLFLAVKVGKVKVLKVLLSDGIDIDARDHFGSTLLHAAIMRRDVQITKELLDAGADVNAPMRNGITPLDEAVGQGDVALAETLISAGADGSAIRQDKHAVMGMKRRLESRLILVPIIGLAVIVLIVAVKAF